MKPKRKPMLTTLFCLLLANQAVETQTPALEQTVHQISYSSKDGGENKKAEVPLLKNQNKTTSAAQAENIFLTSSILFPASHDRQEELWTPP